MAKSYPIREVILAHKELVEQMGTKPKFWAFESETDRRWLFKYIRPNTGEDWSEKIAAEVAQLLGIPHAYVELAACEEARGVLCLDFTKNTTKGELVHGNELLAGIMPDYPKDQRFKVTQHTLGNMARCLEMNFIHLPDGCDLPQGISKPIHLFVGYLLLDAIIGNTDRHHENWGILERRVRPEKPRYAEVAPSFDHASSLGRELTEDKRAQLLESESVDTNVEAYARKARSAFYCQDSDKKPLSTVDAFAFLAKDFPTAACSWLDRLRAVSDNSLCRAVQAVPEERLTRASATFVQRMLRYNKERLLSV